MGKVKVEKDVSWQNINEKLNFWKLKWNFKKKCLVLNFECIISVKVELFNSMNEGSGHWGQTEETEEDWGRCLLENVWISDLQVYQQVAAGTVDVAAVTLEIHDIEVIRYYYDY